VPGQDARGGGIPALPGDPAGGEAGTEGGGGGSYVSLCEYVSVLVFAYLHYRDIPLEEKKAQRDREKEKERERASERARARRASEVEIEVERDGEGGREGGRYSECDGVCMFV
jgi:hypothetical protein